MRIASIGTAFPAHRYPQAVITEALKERIHGNPSIPAVTEIYLPRAHFPRNPRINAPGCHVVSHADGIVLLATDGAGERIVTVSAG